MLIAAGVVAAGVFVNGSVRSLPEFLVEYGIMLALAAAWAAFALLLARDNALAYAVALFGVTAAHGAALCLEQPAPELQRQGWFAAAVLLAVLVWTAAPTLAGRRRYQTSQTAPQVN